jgi:hypothetical protein
VIAVIECLAELRGEDPKAVGESTARNAREAFPGLR